MTARDFVTGCTGKRRFICFGHARRAAKRRNRHDQSHLEAYHCRHCGGFHVGESRRYGFEDERKARRRDAAA
jgi:hypothetical protein